MSPASTVFAAVGACLNASGIESELLFALIGSAPMGLSCIGNCGERYDIKGANWRCNGWMESKAADLKPAKGMAEMALLGKMRLQLELILQKAQRK